MSDSSVTPRDVGYGLAPGAQLALVRKLDARQSFGILGLSLLTASLTALAIATSKAWISIPITVVGLGITFAYGRSAATAPVPRTGPLWSLQRDEHKVAEVHRVLRQTADTLAAVLDLDRESVRANVWGPDSSGHVLFMIPELTIGMSAAELDLRVPAGFGCSGMAFQRREPTIAPNVLDRGSVVRAEDGRELVDRYSLGDQEVNLDRRLAWVISAPIWGRDGAVVIGVISADGLSADVEHIPALSALQGVQHEVVNAAARVRQIAAA